MILCTYIGTPVVEISPQNQDFVRYSNVSFMCTAIGYPRPVISWLNNHIALTNISNGVTSLKLLIINSYLGNCITTKCGLKSTIWILNSTLDDVGTYTCRASNIAGNVTKTAQLTIGNV